MCDRGKDTRKCSSHSRTDLVLNEVKFLVTLKNRICVISWRKASGASWTPLETGDQVSEVGWKLSDGGTDTERQH